MNFNLMFSGPNPMTDEDVKEACKNLPEPKRDLLNAVERFAYESTQQIESRLGEYAGKNFDLATLEAAVLSDIQSFPASEEGRGFLTLAFEKAAVTPEKQGLIVKIIEDEALKRIRSSVYRHEDGRQQYCDHGHHARQYIARNSVARILLENIIN